MRLKRKDADDWAKGLRREIENEIDALLDSLSLGEGGTPRAMSDRTIHSARKSLKKVRAALRVLQPVGRKKRLRKANVFLRDGGRPLSTLRDAAVLVATLASLRQTGVPTAALLKSLRHQQALRREEMQSGRDRLEMQLRRRVEAGRREVRRAVRGVEAGGGELARSLRRLYRRAREAFDEATIAGTDDTLHEARKRAKDLRYALEFALAIRPELTKLSKSAKQLTDALGDDHDLAVLGERLRSPESPHVNLSEAHLGGLLAGIAGKRAKLQLAARQSPLWNVRAAKAITKRV